MVQGDHDRGDSETDAPGLRDAMHCRLESCAKQLVSANVAWAAAGQQASAVHQNHRCPQVERWRSSTFAALRGEVRG